MSQESPLGITIPTISDAADIAAIILEAFTDAENKLLPPQFATTTERDTARASRSFRFCFVGNQPQYWNGTTWVAIYASSAASISAGSAAAAWSQANGTWTQAAGMSTDFQIGPDVTPAANTIRVNQGIWCVSGSVEWAASGSAGARFCGIGFGSGDVRDWDTAPPSPADIRTRASITRLLQVGAANTPICLYGAQTSGGAFNAYARSLSVYRVA